MDTPDWLASPLSETTVAEFGTKAHNLAILTKLGYRVPDCCFIRTFDGSTSPFADSDAYLQAIGEFSSSLNEILPSADGWAVRSSATIEDMPGESHAGRFETVFVAAADELRSAVQTVWASARSANIGPESMGVVLQARIDADHAGVAFSTDPTSADDSFVIEGVRGMGTNLVDGKVTPWRVRGVENPLVVPSDVNAETIMSLCDGMRRLVDHFGHDVDVEWAIRGNELYWLQVRPLTGTRTVTFAIPDEQESELDGLWVRINHSIAPQAPLVATLNPGGYLNGVTWDSCLVNGFHYIRQHKTTPKQIADAEHDRLMDEWDRTESAFERAFADRGDVDLSGLTPGQLWDETQQRITLARDYFGAYSDPDFIQVRSESERRTLKILRSTGRTEDEVSALIGGLLSQLGSKTEHKQALLRSVADIYTEQGGEDIEDSPEWQRFMNSYGFESATTQLFYVPTLAETPELVVELVKQLSDQPVTNDHGPDWRKLSETIECELVAGDRETFRNTLHRLRRCMLRTEDDDYLLGLATSMIRTCFLMAGELFTRAGLLDEIDDVFFLVKDELRDFLLTGRPTPIADVVQKRKRLFSRRKTMSPPPMIVNGRAMTPKSARNVDELSGTAASPGIAQGHVVVVRDPFAHMGRQLPRNAVVVAPVVTPPLAYSLAGCAALVTEAGGLASHGAIVAREMAIPAVVGVKTVTHSLKTGMKVTVDGNSGKIRIDR